MLKKMGWEEGEGLGRHKQGEADPLTLDIKFDKKGLAAAEEDGRRGTVSQQFNFTDPDLEKSDSGSGLKLENPFIFAF